MKIRTADREDAKVRLVTGTKLLALVVLLATLPVTAGARSRDAVLPVDPAVRKGRLDNGLTWIVRQNAKPEARAQLRLVVKAGSVDEDDDQRGLAHFLEHMMFNGTERWAGNDIIDYLESIGARFGPDLNAYTSFDETVYMLEIPTDREGLLRQGIEVLSEFAAHALIDPGEVEKERGVVLDEWRGDRGAGARVRDAQLPVLLKGSRYAERLPIGLPEVIESAPPALLRRFYEDWYRPERMAVIAVGDFDPHEVQEWIEEAFALPPTPDLRERLDWPVPARDDTLFALVDDPELRGTSVGWSLKRPKRPEDGTYETYRRGLVERVTIGAFNERLGELVRSDDAPFLGAGMGTSSWGRTTELTTFDARVRDGEEARGLEALLREVERARRHGFVESEVERVGRGMLASIEATWAERDKTPSGAYVSEYTRHFLEDEPIPGIDVEVELWRDWIPAITAAACHETFLELLEGSGIVVDASRPSRGELVGEAELLEVLRGAPSVEVAPYVDAPPAAALIATPRPPGRIVERKEVESIGATRLVLSNGVRVILKPTDFQDDEVRFVSSAPGGTSVAGDDDLPSARHAAAILAESGWGGHSRIELGKILAGKVVSASPYFDERSHGVSGSSTVADLETALELVVLLMTSPNRDPGAFERYRDRLHASLVNRAADPSARYFDRVVAVNTSDDPRSRPLTVDRLDEVDLDTALDFYRSGFENAADFEFVFVGNLDGIEPLLEKTLGSLPSRGEARSAWVDRGPTFPEGVVEERVRAGREPKGMNVVTLASYGGSDPREWHRIRTACSILGRRLRETLREDLGATYGVRVGYRHEMLGPARGKVRIRFGSDPADGDSLVAVMFRTLEELREDGPTQADVRKEQELQIRDLETAWKQNGYWLGNLNGLAIRGRPLEEMSTRRLRIDELDREGLHRVFREHFRRERYTRVTWEPEETASEAGS